MAIRYKTCTLMHQTAKQTAPELNKIESTIYACIYIFCSCEGT